MNQADTLIRARWVVPVEPADTLLEDHALLIRDGRIEALLPAAQAERDWRAAVRHELPGHVLLPGLVNAHTHAAMSLFRGLADDLPLMSWLEQHIWPAESRWVSEGFVRDGTRLAVAEMIRGGTTCFNDMYFFPDETARAAAEVGMRVCVGLIVLDFPSVWARDAAEYIGKGTEVHDQLRNNPLVRTAFAPHAPYTVGDAPLERVRVLADELDIPVHMHVHESAGEITRETARFGERPLARLDRLGLLSPRLLAVHMTQVEEAEIERVADCGAHVVHCPESNLKLGNGMCPVQRFLDAGASVALGTDGAASNNDLDMLGELRTCALLAKGVAGAAEAVPAAQALRLATLGGARALGLEGVIGSLTAGKEADVIAVSLDEIETQPVYDPVSQLVYAAGRGQVSDVWIAGEHVLRNRALVVMDEQALLRRAGEWRARIADRRGAG